MKKSQKVTFVNSNMQDDYISLPKSTKMLDNMDEDEDNIYMTSIHDRHAAHLNNLESICLAKFAVNYEPLLNSGGKMRETTYLNMHMIVMMKVIIMMTYRSQTLLH